MKTHRNLGWIGAALLATSLFLTACHAPQRAPFERGEAFVAVGLLFES
jgi:hypothetical protein